jgi:hypothetical protein
VAGRTLADLIRSIFVLFVVLAVGLLIGFQPEGTILNWGAALGLILLIDFLFIWFSAFLGLVLNSVEAIQQAWTICTLPLLFQQHVCADQHHACLAGRLRGVSTAFGVHHPGAQVGAQPA